MRIVLTFVLSSAVILCSIKLSSEFDCLPNGEPIPVVPHHNRLSSSSRIRQSPEKSRPPATTHPSAKYVPPPEPVLRIRSRSPLARRALTHVLGFKVEELGYVRLIPCDDPSEVFELRRYVFPCDKPIRLRARNKVLLPMPTEEQIVLTSSNGDVCAIVEKLSNRNTIFRAIYKPVDSGSKRANINMISGTVEILTTRELANCPVGQQSAVLKNFRISHV